MNNSEILYENTERETWIDISRAILIILVVSGHFYRGIHWQLNHYIDYVYLFHMPAFFIISGYLYKPISNIRNIKEVIIKKFKRLFIPYISYLMLISIIRYFYLFLISKESFEFLIKDFLKNIYGGRYLNSLNGVLWFLSALFFVEIIWIFVDVKFKSEKVKICIVFILYVVAHVQSWLLSSITGPLGVEFVLLCLSYYVFGVKFKKYILNRNVFIIALFISLIFLSLRILNFINYGLEIAALYYKDLILDFLIPVAISIVIFYISSKIKIRSNNIIVVIGQFTLPIMCLHVGINKLFQSFFNYGLILYTLIGVIIPLFISLFIFNKNKTILKLFTGK